MINKKVLLRKIKEKMREKFLNSDLWKKFGPRELKKTRQEKEMIRLMQKKIDERFGQSSKLRRIYLKDIHVFSFADFQELVKEFGIYELIRYQGICEAVTTYFWAPQTFIARFDALSEFTHALLHDMIHAKSFWDVDFISLTNWESPLMKPAIKRSGLIIKKWGFSLNSLLKRPDLDYLDENKIRELTKETVYFDSLNEAVIEELTKEIFNELIIEHSQLDAEAEPLRWAKQPKRIQQWHVFRRYLKPLEEVFLLKIAEVREGEEKAWEVRLIPSFFSYQKQRQRLYYLIRQIAEKKGIEYEEAKKQVMSVLTEALFTGRILPAARLIDGTLGKGTFRHIGKRGKLPNMVKPSNI